MTPELEASDKQNKESDVHFHTWNKNFFSPKRPENVDYAKEKAISDKRDSICSWNMNIFMLHPPSWMLHSHQVHLLRNAFLVGCSCRCYCPATAATFSSSNWMAKMEAAWRWQSAYPPNMARVSDLHAAKGASCTMDQKWVTTGGLEPTKLVVVFEVQHPSTTTTCNFTAESVNNGTKEFRQSADLESPVNAAGQSRSMKKQMATGMCGCQSCSVQKKRISNLCHINSQSPTLTASLKAHKDAKPPLQLQSMDSHLDFYLKKCKWM